MAGHERYGVQSKFNVFNLSRLTKICLSYSDLHRWGYALELGWPQSTDVILHTVPLINGNIYSHT